MRREAQYGNFVSELSAFTSFFSVNLPLFVLQAFKFNENNNQNQSDIVQFWIKLLIGPIAALYTFISLLVFLFYPLTAKLHKMVLEGISLHKQGKLAVDPLTNQVLLPPKFVNWKRFLVADHKSKPAPGASNSMLCPSSVSSFPASEDSDSESRLLLETSEDESSLNYATETETEPETEDEERGTAAIEAEKSEKRKEEEDGEVKEGEGLDRSAKAKKSVLPMESIEISASIAPEGRSRRFRRKPNLLRTDVFDGSVNSSISLSTSFPKDYRYERIKSRPIISKKRASLSQKETAERIQWGMAYFSFQELRSIMKWGRWFAIFLPFRSIAVSFLLSVAGAILWGLRPVYSFLASFLIMTSFSLMTYHFMRLIGGIQFYRRKPSNKAIEFYLSEPLVLSQEYILKQAKHKGEVEGK